MPPNERDIDPIEQSVTELIEIGKRRKYLTWEELNEALPDEAVSPDKLESVLNRIEHNGIQMIDDAGRFRFGNLEVKQCRASGLGEHLPAGPTLQVADLILAIDLAEGEVARTALSIEHTLGIKTTQPLEVGSGFHSVPPNG